MWFRRVGGLAVCIARATFYALRRYFKVRELQALGEVKVYYCPTDLNWADFLTKVVSPEKWRACKHALAGSELHP